MPRNSTTDWIAAICAIITIALTVYFGFLQDKPLPTNSNSNNVITGNSNIIGNNNQISITDPNKESILPIDLADNNLYKLAERVTSKNIRIGNARIVKIPGIKPYFVTLTESRDQKGENNYVFQSYKYQNESWVLSLSDTLLPYNFDVVGSLEMYSSTRKVEKFYDYESKNAITFSGCITHQCHKTFGFYCYFPEIDKGYMSGVDHFENIVIPTTLFSDAARMEYFEELLVLENKIIRINRESNLPGILNGYKKFFSELPANKIYPNHKSEKCEAEISNFDKFIRLNITQEHDDIFGIYFGDFFNTGTLWYALQLVKLEYYDSDKFLIDWSRFVFISSENINEHFILPGDGVKGKNDIIMGDSFKIFSSIYSDEKVFGFISEDWGGKVPTYYVLAYSSNEDKSTKLKNEGICKNVWNTYGNPKYYFNCR